MRDSIWQWLSSGFMPHGHCYLWQPGLIALQVAANLAIGLAYLSISLLLVQLVRRTRNLPFEWAYLAFGLFIVACGITHFMDVVVIWAPLYWVDGGLRAITAVASVGTAALLFPLVRKAAALANLAAAHRDANEALRQSEERFRLLVEQVADYAIFLLDPEGRVVTWNLGAQRAKGYTEAEILGKDFSIFYPAEDIAAGKPARQLRTVAANGRHEDEGWRLRKDGTRFWANVVLTALRDGQGRLRGFAKVTRDITDRKVAQRHEEEIGQAGVTLALRCPEAPVTGTWDRGRIEQVLTNLLTNAIKYGHGHPIEVALCASEDRAVLTVTDEGIGIAPEDQGRIFERFERAVSARHYGGLGLGLWIAQQAVAAMGGSIGVKSAVGMGSTFTVELPRRT